MWIASKNKKGYGMFGVKQGFKSWKIEYAHRVSYREFVGEIPQGLLVLHKCDTPSCVNPDHLFVGTNQDNCDDKWRKGRQADQIGENNGRSVLTEFDVIRIRSLNGVMERKEIAKRFNVSLPLVHKIINRRLWKHI